MGLLAVAVLGPDRPGIIARLTQVLLADGGNLEDCSMTRLRGQFAMTLLVDVELTAQQVSVALASVAHDLDLTVTARTVTADAGRTDLAATLRLRGADQPGLVHRVADLLATRGVNIIDLRTRLLSGAAYVATFSLDVTGQDWPVLATEVQALARELGVEASLHRSETTDADA